MRPLVEVKSRKARCCTPCPDMAAIKRTIAKYICCIPTTLILGISAALRASQHSFYSVQLLSFLFPVAMVPLLKLILKESWTQYTGLMLSMGVAEVVGRIQLQGVVIDQRLSGCVLLENSDLSADQKAMVLATTNRDVSFSSVQVALTRSREEPATGRCG